MSCRPTIPNITKKVKFYIGDVRNIQSLRDVMPGVNYIFHAAALKQVPSCEFFPMEAVRTNIEGTDNMLHAAIEANVETGRLPVHRQGSVSHQRHGHFQGHDGACHHCATPVCPPSGAVRSSAAPGTATSWPAAVR